MQCIKIFPLSIFSKNTDMVNDLNTVIKYVVSLLNLKISKTLYLLNSTIATLV